MTQSSLGFGSNQGAGDESIGWIFFEERRSVAGRDFEESVALELEVETDDIGFHNEAP
jgi:hypothetical protein